MLMQIMPWVIPSQVFIVRIKPSAIFQMLVFGGRFLLADSDVATIFTPVGAQPLGLAPLQSLGVDP